MGTITDSEVKEVSKLIEENTVEEDKKVVQFPSNNGILENESNDLEPETKQVKASINVNTGAIDTLLNDDDSELQIDPELMKLLTMEDDDVYKVPENVSDIKVSDDELKKSAESLGFGEEDIIAIMPLLKKYMDGEDLNWYNELPANIRKQIDKSCLEVNNTSREAKKLFASELISNIITDCRFDKVVIDFQEAINKVYDLSPVMEMAIGEQKTLFEKKIDEVIAKSEDKIKNATDEEAIEKINKSVETLKGIKESYRQSYTLENFIEEIKSGKIRVKDFDIRKFDRYVNDFNFFYNKKNNPFVISNIKMTVPVLCRKFVDTFTEKEVITMIISFIKHCKNKNGFDVVDHTYMSYFISNIICLDGITSNQGQEAFSTLLTNNLEAAIKAANNL